MARTSRSRAAADDAVDEAEDSAESLPVATVGEPYRHQLHPGVETMPPWSFSMPVVVAGLSLKNAGLLVGTPEGPATGDEPLALQITSHDGNGEATVTDYLLTIVDPAAPAVEAVAEQVAEDAPAT